MIVLVMFILIVGSIAMYIISFNLLDKKFNDAYRRGYQIGYDYGYQKGLKEQEKFDAPDEEMEKIWDDIKEMVTVNE